MAKIIAGKEHIDNARRLLSKIEFELMEPDSAKVHNELSHCIIGLDITYQNIGAAIVNELSERSRHPNGVSEL